MRTFLWTGALAILTLVACLSCGAGAAARSPVTVPALRGSTVVLAVSGAGQVEIFILGADGGLAPAGQSTVGSKGGYGAFAAGNAHVYLADEDKTAGSLVGFRVSSAPAELQRIGTWPSGGRQPVHVFAPPGGRWLLVANFLDPNVTVFPIGAEGVLGPAAAQVNPGRTPHQALTDPSGRFVFIPCRDDDHIAQYRFDSRKGTLTPNHPLRVSTPGRPRHLAFHPSGRFAYLMTESDIPVVAYRFDARSGALADPKPVDTRAGGGAHIVVSPDGAFVYGSVRRSPAVIYVFAVKGDDGSLIEVQAFSAQDISGPRDFALSPDGRFLVVGGQEHHQLVVLARDPHDGRLRATGKTAKTRGSPAFVGVVPSP